MSRTEDVFKPALAGKKIPVLTLDNKWHQLFTQTEPDKRLKRLEEKVNKLIQKQGKANTEVKSIRGLKKKLMKEIIDNAEEASVENDPAAQKRTDESKRLINECNEKIEDYREELIELPKEIERANYELMLATMEICYDRMKENQREIYEITQWVNDIRVELKKKLIRKQEKEDMNQELYFYMHDIFGADVINIFDTKYRVKKRENAENNKVEL